jgi:predicted transcriptional regulator
MSRGQKPPLSELENKVMAVVWQNGEATAEFVRTALEPSQPLKDSTIRTILQRLEKKGYVRHRIDGRTYVYSPSIASRSVAVDAVRSIINRFCQGSVEDLLVGMVDREIVSAEQLRSLAQRIAVKKRKDDQPLNKRGRKKGT